MKGRLLTAAVAATVIAAATPSLAAADSKSLPSVTSGERPGPPLLYRDPPRPPILSVARPFKAAPLLVSGSSAYRDGEFLYQDYLFDDRGADTAPLVGSKSDPSSDIAATPAGDVQYPDGKRYSDNAADLVEFRVKPLAEAIVYRITLNSVIDRDAAVVGIGIDTDRSGGAAVEWPGGAGVSSSGIDRFISAWGTGGEVAKAEGGSFAAPERLGKNAVSIDMESNQMLIRIPRRIMDPGAGSWRYVAGTGLLGSKAPASDERWLAPRRGQSPDGSGAPASGSAISDAPAVFNLAFRYDEPQKPANAPPVPEGTTFPGVGIWFEENQAQLLADRTTGDLHSDVDFGALDRGVTRHLDRRPGRDRARILASRLDLPEGRADSFPGYGGVLQPYLVTVPKGGTKDHRAGLTFTLHSLGGTYTQYAVFSPQQLEDFGGRRGDVVVSPLGHGTDGWYTDEAEVDFFEAWADAAKNYRLAPDRVALTGYSMGGYGTYKLGTQYPDLFGRAFTTVGPPGLGVWLPPAPPTPGGASSLSTLVLGNVRWVPYLNWVASSDELVPIVGPVTQQRTFDELGLRSSLRIFSPAEHFTLATLDRWDEARDFLGRAPVVRDPWRVDYAFLPAADRRRLGLRHDHAYWISDLRARDRSGDPDTVPSRGRIDARSLA